MSALCRSASILVSVRTDTTIYRARVRQSPRRIALRRTVFVTVFAVLLLVLVGLAFAGSASTLPAGTMWPASTWEG